MKYLALGDSYTIGEQVEQKGTYPYLLQQFLSDHSLEVDVNVIAETGWTAQELFETYSDKSIKREYDLVTLLIGVNNQYRKHDFSYFVKGFETMLNEAISKSIKGESNVFVLSIPNYGLTPFGHKNVEQITKQIQMYNTHIQKRCELYGVGYRDINGPYAKYATEYLVEDGLHPSTEMYKEWVNYFKEDVLEVLSN